MQSRVVTTSLATVVARATGARYKAHGPSGSGGMQGWGPGSGSGARRYGRRHSFSFLLLWKWATLPAIHPAVIVNPTTSYCPLVVLKMGTDRGLLTCCALVLVCSK